MTANVGRNKTTIRLTDSNALFLEEYAQVTCSWKNSVVNKLIKEFSELEDVQEILREHKCRSAQSTT